MSVSRIVGVLGAALVLAGAVLGLTGVSAGGVSCGRVFHHSTSYLAATDECSDALSGRKAPTVVLLALGVAGVLGWCAVDYGREVIARDQEGAR